MHLGLVSFVFCYQYLGSVDGNVVCSLVVFLRSRRVDLVHHVVGCVFLEIDVDLKRARRPASGSTVYDVRDWQQIFVFGYEFGLFFAWPDPGLIRSSFFLDLSNNMNLVHSTAR
jgi:hypothetical protein